MAKILKFPNLFDGHDIDRSSVRVAALQKRIGVIEQRMANYQEDINFINSCMEEDTVEFSELLNELASIQGFEEEL